jgi:hypothetical protein
MSLWGKSCSLSDTCWNALKARGLSDPRGLRLMAHLSGTLKEVEEALHLIMNFLRKT